MFIDKDERISRATLPRRSGWDRGSRRRAPRNWFKIARVVLYALTSLLAGIAVLAAAVLFLDHGASVPPPVPHPAPDQTAEAAPPPAPAPVAPPPAAAESPATTPAPPPASASVPATEQADPKELEALQSQIRDANSTLSAPRAQTDALRGSLADARQHQTAAPQAPPAPGNQQRGDNAGWADAERTVQALARHTPPAPRPEPQPAAPQPAAPQPATNLAANAPLPSPAPDAPRPRVFLHYPAGSSGGLQAATDIAQRLLFSDFAYADTRSATSAPTDSVVRYFFSQDAPAAQRLAALLSDGRTSFRAQDATAHPGRATAGTLDVWIGR